MARIKGLLAQLSACLRVADIPSHKKVELCKFLGLKTLNASWISCIAADRQSFDTLIGTLLRLTGFAIPIPLRFTIVAVRHCLPWSPPTLVPNGDVKVVCLFPIAASASPRVLGHQYQFDSGWRTDGLFLWLGQRERKGHLEVQEALEDCCGPHQAVLLFTRPRQCASHTFVGRVRGYLPVSDQDSATKSPFRAALMLDTLSPFQLTTASGKVIMEPGCKPPGTSKTRVCQYLGLEPPARYARQGFCVASLSGRYNAIRSLDTSSGRSRDESFGRQIPDYALQALVRQFRRRHRSCPSPSARLLPTRLHRPRNEGDQRAA